MNKIESIIISTGLLSLTIPALLGGFGSMVYYLTSLVKTKEQYCVKSLTLYFIFGSFTGMLAYELTPNALFDQRLAIILISGYLAIKILDFLDVNGLKYLTKKLKQ